MTACRRSIWHGRRSKHFFIVQVNLHKIELPHQTGHHALKDGECFHNLKAQDFELRGSLTAYKGFIYRVSANPKLPVDGKNPA